MLISLMSTLFFSISTSISFSTSSSNSSQSSSSSSSPSTSSITAISGADLATTNPGRRLHHHHHDGSPPPSQIGNYNYGPAGRDMGMDLLSNPDLVATDPVISFKTAIRFWMTEQLPKPSCHNVIIGEWTPSREDQLAGRLPGYGVTTNIINGGLECGHGPDPRVEDRIGFYLRYCDIFGVSPGDNLDCANQRPFGYGVLLDSI